MGLLTFIKEAGEKLFGINEAKAAEPTAAATAAQASSDASSAAASAIVQYIKTQNLDADGLAVAFDGVSATVTVSGQAPDQETREKIVLCCGNVTGVEHVDDQMSVAESTEIAQFYTVKRGDTLSAVAKAYYGNANAYMKIFEANKPMLSHPDKIYPGQMLRIPASSV